MNIPDIPELKNIKEAMAELKPILEDHAVGRHRFIYSEEARALQTLLSTCQLLCDVNDNMFSKKEFVSNDEIHLYYEKGYNLARSEDILWLTKRMMGMEEWLENNVAEHLDLSGYSQGKGYKDLTNAIRQEILK